MAVYAIFIKEKTRDSAEMATYMKMAGPTLEGYHAKPLAVYGPQVTQEGPASEGVVLVEFPSMDAAKSWYESDGYRAARAHRFLGADYRAIFVEGV